MIEVIDLFAGPGGWDLAAHALGLDPLGIEIDDSACATRHAAGLRTLQADVAALDPSDHHPCDLLIASPPCTAFSMAGNGKGRDALFAYATAIEHMRLGAGIDRDWLDTQCSDETAHLVLEPLRWALALRPTLIACEQVPPVLPLWQLTADVLRERCYHTWTGRLSAECYGVPQTRERAFLLASRAGPVQRPRATHQRYIAPRRRDAQDESLFDQPDPERIVAPGERDLLPWVSMAEALGWGMTARPYPVIACSRHSGGPDKEKVGGSAARQVIYDEQAAGRWFYRNGNQENAARRRGDEPAPTLHFGHALNSGVEWTTTPDEPWRPVEYDSRGQRDTRSGEPVFARHRKIDEPAPTIAGQSRNDSWVTDRPATAVQGDPRVFHPGGHIANDGRDNSKMIGRSQNAVRVTLPEALVLQSFPPDYPVQGTATKQFEQVGNAVPPLWAWAILSALLNTPAEASA